ncbi:MAG: F0F1 ATP synthase subunit A [Desulfobacteraceae bacterium]
MEHPYLFFVKFLELISGGPNSALAHWAHGNVHVIYTWVVMAILIVLGWLAGKNTQLIPEPIQNVFEVLISGLEEFMVEITGEEGRWLFPLTATIFVFVFLGNLMGLVPGFFSPTANLNTTLSMALVVVLLTHVIGVKYHGAKYIKHFLGPVWWMVPIIFPIEIIGHVARILSLSFRLFGNMMGHELVLIILFGLAGAFFAPLPIMALGIFVALVQAFVFFLLSVMYFAGAIEEAH